MATTAQQALAQCIARCAQAKDGRGAWRAEYACVIALEHARPGATPIITANTAAAARRIGEWLRHQPQQAAK